MKGCEAGGSVPGLDDLAERLRRGLTDRAAKGREALAGVGSLLTPRLIERKIEAGKDRLERSRLTPSLVEQPIARSQDKLDALARLASQLHPRKPLERGYAMVFNAAGEVMTSKAQAEREAALKLQFKDDVLDVSTGAASPPPAAPKRKPAAPKATPPRQDDLFGD